MSTSLPPATHELGWPVTGRAEELRAARRALRPPHAGVLVAGAAGVGKTRLALHLLREAGPAWQVRWFAATASSKPLALGVFGRDAADLGEDPLTRTTRLAAKLAEAPPGRRALVGVDDAHNLDPLSAFVLNQVAARGAATLVLTARSRERCPDAVTALWKDRLVDRIELQPITPAEARDLVEAVLGGPVETSSLQRIWDLTLGNLLFLRCVVEDEVAAGRIRRVAGLWVWAGRHRVSSGLAELVEQRMGELDGTVRDAVDYLAVGEPLPLGVLTGLVGRAAVEHAEQQHLLEVSGVRGSREARLAHPLYAEVRIATAGQARLRRLRAAVAAALAGAPAEGPTGVLKHAVLALGSDGEPDPVVLAAGARAAMGLLDLRLAERLALAATAAGGGGETQLTYATTLVLLGRGADAEEVFARSDLRPGEPGFALAATARAANLVWMCSDPAAAQRVLDGCRPHVGADLDRRAHLAVQACVHAVRADAHAGAEAAAAALAGGGPEGGLPPFHRMMALAAWTMCAGALGRIAEMEAAAQEGLALARAHPETAHLRFWLGAIEARAYRLSGHLDRLLVSARDLRAQAEHAVPGLAHAQTSLTLGHAALAVGDLADAARWLTEAYAAAQMYDTSTGLRPAILLWLAETHASTGDPAAAARAVHALDGVLPAQFRFMDTAAELVRAWLSAAQGVPSAAVERALAAANQARARGLPANEVLCLQAAAQFGDPAGAARLAGLAAELASPRAQVAARHAAALAAADGDGLDRAARGYLEMGDKVAAADAAAQASAAHTRAGHPAAAHASAAQARRSATACDRADTPAVRAAAGPVPFTDREREIIRLLAEGHPTRVVAERLALSTRTVENHIYRAAKRAGVTGRDGLAGLV